MAQPHKPGLLLMDFKLPILDPEVSKSRSGSGSRRGSRRGDNFVE